MIPRRLAVGITVVVAAAVHGCRDSGSAPSGDADPAGSALTLESPNFAHGTSMPRRHAVEGEDRSPPLAWRHAPAATRGFALICEDLDAPTPKPWVHWIIFDLPAATMGLAEGVPREPRARAPAGTRQGINSWGRGNYGYRGPAPPRGDDAHRYRFRLFAVDIETLPESTVDRATLLEAIRGHVIAEAELIGTYERD